MRKEEFVKILTGAGKLYNKELDKEELMLWFSFFKDNTIEQFKEAVNIHIKTSNKFPTVADIKNEIAKLQTNDIPNAEDEWELVLKSVRQYGSYRVQDAMNTLKPYTAYIVSHIGYINICMSEDQTWNKKEFISEYNSMKDKEIHNIQIGCKERNFVSIQDIKLIEQ